MQEERARDNMAKSIADNDNKVSQGLENYDLNMETKIKDDKKAHAKEQLKIIKQFDNMATSFQKTATKVDQSEIKETASMVRKREKEKTKKEKTLAAKLRLKAKKNK